jgi:DNA-binding response OmpR family regulator
VLWDAGVSQRLLVVDDDPGIREVMRIHFGRQGYGVDCAPGLEDAKALLSATSYAAVVTDLQLTPAEGREGLAVVVEARKRWPGIAVVVITGYVSDEVRIAARRLRVDALLHKGSSIAELERSVRALVFPGDGSPSSST